MLGNHIVKKKILLVDDDQRMLDALRRTLHDFVDEWDMTFIQHPEEAWKVLKEGTFDAVVTDVRMPGITGFDLLDRIQHDEEMKDVPVVILTGLNDNELKEKALDGGALDLLNQPF